MAAIVSTLIAGFGLLVIAMSVLVYLNWSSNIFERVLSIALIGVATILAAVIVTLKETSVDAAFTSPVILNVTEGAPPLVVQNPDGRPFIANLMELGSLGRPARQQNGASVLTVAKPNEGELFTFCGELLEYQIVKTIRKLQRGGWKFGMSNGYAIADVSTPMKLTEIENYPGAAFLPVVAGNRFANSDSEDFLWRGVTFPLPRNSRVTLIHIEAGQGAEQHVVRIEKPLFFRIDFTITPLGATGNGLIPKGVILTPPELAAQCRTFQFKVAMHATFERMTAGNWRTDEYKAWTDWLFNGLKENLAE